MPPTPQPKNARSGSPLPALSRSSPEPLYQQLARLLAGQIDSGELAAGAQLESEPDLMAKYGVSRVTVRQATALLRRQGRLVARRGKGTFVAGRLLTHDLDALHGFYDALRSQGVEPRTRLLEFAPEGGVRDPENLAPGQLPVRLKRLYYLDERPFALVVAYLPEAARALGEHKAQLMTAYQIVSHLGIRVTHADVTIRCQRAGRSVARLLGLKQAESMLVMERRSFSNHGAVCEAMRIHIVPERYEFRLSIPGALEIARSVHPVQLLADPRALPETEVL